MAEGDPFYFELPLFIIDAPHDPSVPVPEHFKLNGPFVVTTPDITSLAVFTDRKGAEQFRDETAPGYRVIEMNDPKLIVAILRALRPTVDRAALDLHRLGMAARTVQFAEMIATLEK